MIFQDPYGSLDPRQSVKSIVKEALTAGNEKQWTKGELEERISDLLNTVGLDTSLGDRYPHEMSGGQRQRLGIARALACAPRLIVCDEPVSACCIPILTVGASAAALFASIRDIIKGRDSKIISRYFNHWIKDFGKATVLFVPVLLVLGVILLDVLYLYRQKTVSVFDAGILIAAAAACIGVYLGTLQMFVEFDNTIWQTWVNGGKLFTARVPHIFLGVLMLLLPWAILFLFPTKFYQLFILFMLIGLSGPVYVLQLLLQPTVKAISDASEKRENELEGKT